MTERPALTQALTPSLLSSMPRPSTCLNCTRYSSSVPSPQPTSSTRERGSIRSAISCRSTRMMGDAGVIAGSGERQAAMLRRAREETAQYPAEVGLVEQECVVAVVGDDFGEADVGGDRAQGMDDAP